MVVSGEVQLPAALEITGMRFGRLVAIRRVGTSFDGCATWECVCDCGTGATVKTAALRSGNTKSCGCLQRETAIANSRKGRFRRRAVVGYAGAHCRVRTIRGRARIHMCPCGAPAAHWSYDHGDPSERYETRTRKGLVCVLPFSLDLWRYTPLCAHCHKTADDAHRAMSPA